MSVKIHDGFVVQPDHASLHDLHRLTTEFRSIIAPAARRFCVHVFLRDAIFEYDRRTIGLPALSEGSPCSYAWATMLDAHREIRGGHRRPRYDASFEISFFPHPDGRILGIAHSERADWKTLWQAKSEIQEYAYWDNTDSPSSLSAADWRRRKEDWWAVLLSQGGSIPTKAGFCTMIHDEGYPPDPTHLSDEDVQTSAPSRADRASRIAGESVLAAEDTTALSGREILHAMATAERDGRTDAEAQRIAPLLDPAPTLAGLKSSS